MKVSSKKQSLYWERWVQKQLAGSRNHPIGREFRQRIGRKFRLEKMINDRLMKQQLVYETYQTKIDELDLEIREYQLEQNKVDTAVNKFLRETETINPVIIYNTGRNKQYVHGKVWWWRYGFGVTKGDKLKDRGKKEYYRFHLGLQGWNDKNFCKDKYGEDWFEYYFEDDSEWHKICRIKFINKILNK